MEPTTRITRARFAAGATAAIAAAPAFIRSAGAAAQFQYKHGHHLPATSPIHIRYVQMWDAVRRETNGRVDVQVFPANQLGTPPAMLTQLRTGAIQFFTASGGTMSAIVPSSAIELTGFAFRTVDQGFKAMDGPLGAYIRKDIEKTGLMAAERVWGDGFEVISSTNKPIHSVEDMKGLKLRAPIGAAWVDLFKALGASPTTVDLGEMYTALQTHIVDAQSSPFLEVGLLKLYEIQKFVALTNHIFVGFFLVANGDAIKALPADLQAIVWRNSTKFALLERGDIAVLTRETTADLKRRGMTITTVNGDEFRKTLRPYYLNLKNQIGATPWGLLEATVGKLV